MKMLTVLIGSIVLLLSLPVGAVDGPELTSAVFIMNADGSDQHALFPYPIGATGLACSPDGTRIAYSGSGHRGPDIWVSDFDGGNAVNLTNTSGVMEFNPSWSPDGSRIVYCAQDKDFSTEIFVIDADGTNVMNLTNHPAGDTGPSWSPGGNYIAFSSDREGTEQIYVMNSNGSGVRNLTNHFVENVHYGQPSWSPDGSRIAYTANVAGNRSIYVMNANGESSQVLMPDTHDSQPVPAWSPDGSRIAFAANRDGDTDIYVMNTGGQNTVNLTGDVGINGHPTWTPDGRIVFSTRRNPTELADEYLGSASVLIIFEEVGLMVIPRNGDMPPVQLRRTDVSGNLEFISLSRQEAEDILQQRGESDFDLDVFFNP